MTQETELLEFGRDVLRQEAAGIARLVDGLDDSFEAAAALVLQCRGHVVVSGIGKPWLIGQKLSATLASTGTPSFALHPSEAMHGDLGRLREQDVVVLLSNSGSSEEIVRLLPVLKRIGCATIGMTSVPESPLSLAADVVLNMGAVDEACPLGMAPSVSTTMLLALGDALALAVMQARAFGREDYARFHPGGALGRSLMRVTEIMRPLDETPWVAGTATVADALNCITLHKAGAVFVQEGGNLAGVFTDGDLRRHINDDSLLSAPIAEVMTRDCQRVLPEALATEAVTTLQNLRIGELPVVDASGELQGHVALKDLVAMHFL